MKINSRSGAGIKQINGVVQEACKEKIERDRRRGIMNRPVRAMVVGIPNVGKSTFINSFAGKACAKTGNKPGVTKGNQWIRLNKTLELLDTPGILWPKFEDQRVGLYLALIGAIKDEILNIDELSLELIKILLSDYPTVLKERYGVEEDAEPPVILGQIAENRKVYLKGRRSRLQQGGSTSDRRIPEWKTGTDHTGTSEDTGWQCRMRQTEIRAVFEIILYFALVACITFLIIHFVRARTGCKRCFHAADTF